MSFVGMIAKKKKEKEFEKMKEVVYPNELIFISEKNLDNIKNVKFETILVQDKIPSKETFEKIVSNCKYLIINSDSVDWNVIKKEEPLAIITYGYHSKDTVTFSSLTEKNIQICLQRNIPIEKGEWIEPQEISLNKNKNDQIEDLLVYGILKILYGKRL